MRKIFTILALSLMLTAGCKKNTVPQPLAPGYSTQADQQLGQLLSSARSFYLSFEKGVTSGQYIETAQEKMAFQQFSVALNAADAAYVAYHAGTGTFAAAQTAGTQVQNQLTQIQSQFPNTAGVK